LESHRFDAIHDEKKLTPKHSKKGKCALLLKKSEIKKITNLVILHKLYKTLSYHTIKQIHEKNS